MRLTVEKFRYFPQKGKILFKLIFVVNRHFKCYAFVACSLNTKNSPIFLFLFLKAWGCRP